MLTIFPALQLLDNSGESIRKHIAIAIIALFVIVQIGITQMFFSWRMDVRTSVYPSNGTLLGHTGRWTIDACSDVHKSKTKIMLSERSQFEIAMY